MYSDNLPHTDKDDEQQRGLLPKSASSLSSTLPSTLSSTSTVKEPHDALFRAFNIWIIYENIFARAAPADKTALALTCRRLRQSFPDAANVHTLRRRLSRPDFLNVLRAIAYDLPDHYVCEQCMYLHRDARAAQRKVKTGEWELITGHAADTAVVQKASEDFLVGKFAPNPMPELEPPCHLSTAIRASSPSSTPLYDAGLSTFTFTGRLSSTRRTPLAGLTHRDVQLLLKRVRMLREQREHGEGEKYNKSGPLESKAIEQRLTERAPSPAPAFRKPWGTSDKAQAQDESKTTGQDLEMEEAVRLALRPFLAQREFRIPGTIYFPMPALKYKFVPRVVLAPCDSHDGKAGHCGHRGHRRAHFLLQTVITVCLSGCRQVPLCICPHQMLSNMRSLPWTQALYAAIRAQQDEDRIQGTRNRTHSILQGFCPTPEGVRNARPPFRLQTAADCVVSERLSKHDYHAGMLRHRYCQECKFEENTEGINSAKRNYAATAQACAMARAHVDGCVVSSSCDRCPTDFVAQTIDDPAGRALNDTLVITVWQDFGPEAPVTDELWQSHIPGLFLQAEMEDAQAPYTEPNTWQSGPSVRHSPGSVRALFEKGEPAFEL